MSVEGDEAGVWDACLPEDEAACSDGAEACSDYDVDADVPGASAAIEAATPPARTGPDQPAALGQGHTSSIPGAARDLQERASRLGACSVSRSQYCITSSLPQPQTGISLL